MAPTKEGVLLRRINTIPANFPRPQTAAKIFRNNFQTPYIRKIKMQFSRDIKTKLGGPFIKENVEA